MNSVDEIKNSILHKVNLKDFLSGELDLKSQGGRWQACCPFHEENTPSFYVFSDHYHCFGCGAHGDVINYVSEKRGLGFIESLKVIGDKIGLDCSALSKNQNEKNLWRKEAKYSRLLSAAQDFFVASFWSNQGSKARDYLFSRHFTKEQAKEFRFGFAPASSQALVRFLLKKGFSAQEIAHCSLANVYEGKAYDFFRNRLMFPIFDPTRKIVAFAGRNLDKEGVKYKNSRYDKKKLLYSFDQAAPFIKKKGRVIVVEGYMDALRLASFGFLETVAAQGTNLSRDHMKLLKPLTPQVYLLFDGDEAGRKASLKLLGDALQLGGLSIRVVSLPNGEDPDSFMLKHGEQALEDALKASKPLTELAIETKFKESCEQKIPEVIRKDFIPWLEHISDPIERSYLIQKISYSSGISASLILSQLSSLNKQEKMELVKPRQSEDFHHLPSYVLDFFGLIYFCDPQSLDLALFEDFYKNSLNLGEPWQSLLDEFLLCFKNEKVAPFEKSVNHWFSSSSEEVMLLLNHLNHHNEAFKVENSAQKLRTVILLHRKRLLKKQIKDLKSQIVNIKLNSLEERLYWSKIVGEIKSLNAKLDHLELE